MVARNDSNLDFAKAPPQLLLDGPLPISLGVTDRTVSALRSLHPWRHHYQQRLRQHFQITVGLSLSARRPMYRPCMLHKKVLQGLSSSVRLWPAKSHFWKLAESFAGTWNLKKPGSSACTFLSGPDKLPEAF